MLTVAVPKRNKLQNIIVLTPKDGFSHFLSIPVFSKKSKALPSKSLALPGKQCYNITCLSELS